MKASRYSVATAAAVLAIGIGYAPQAQNRPAGARQPASPSYEKQVLPVLKKYCVPCHSGPSAPAGLNLAAYSSRESVVKHLAVWEKISRQIATGAMPPPGSPAPSASQRQSVVTWIDTTISAECKLADPGRVTIRRLNREEYNRTIRDLFGVDLRPADEFPSDDVGYGFDNIGDVLSSSPLLVERYLSAAEKIAERVIRVPEDRVRKFEGDALSGIGGVQMMDDGTWALTSVGEVATVVDARVAGDYVLRVTAWAQQAGPEIAKMALVLNGKRLAVMEVKAERGKPLNYEVPMRLTVGKHRVSAGFINDYYQPNDPNPHNRDRNLFIEGLEVAAPPQATGATSEFQSWLESQAPPDLPNAQRATRMLTALARRVYRRPAKPEEVERLVGLVALAEKNGEPFEQGLRLALQAMLCSPHFIYRVEVDAQPRSGTAIRRLNDYELASRLAYFLWASTPDETLLSLADRGLLSNKDTLITQVNRMLRSAKADALTQVFAEQWLTLRKLDQASPDPTLFPVFDEELRIAMKQETLLLFDSVRKEDRSVVTLLDARYTYVNEPLAKLYGIPGIRGRDMVKVALADDKRGGLLTQASILTLTSNPNRTSPVKRGKWVLEQVLGEPPPPPPPGVGNLSQERAAVEGKSLKQRLEQHRSDPTCASCHARMDGIGFGLENFDAIGRWREKDGGLAIDSTAALPNGAKFSGPAGLRKYLLSRKDQFVRTFVEFLLTYALGRGLEVFDRCAVDSIVKAAKKGDYKFSAIVRAIVLSDPFTKRRGASGPT
jgi:hypothetical protein